MVNKLKRNSFLTLFVGIVVSIAVSYSDLELFNRLNKFTFSNLREECHSGDLNGDDVVNVIDIIQMVNCILENNCTNCEGDLNEDGVYNVLDIILQVSCIIDGDCPIVNNEIVYYDSNIENITFNNCITCHSGINPSGGIKLDNYQDVRYHTEFGNLINRINDESNPMPPNSLMPFENRELFQLWLEDGFKNGNLIGTWTPIEIWEFNSDVCFGDSLVQSDNQSISELNNFIFNNDGSVELQNSDGDIFQTFLTSETNPDGTVELFSEDSEYGSILLNNETGNLIITPNITDNNCIQFLYENTNGGGDDGGNDNEIVTSSVIPININDIGFEFLDKMQGHWIGSNSVVGLEYDWFAFDYRAISPSHVFGIHEGGTTGNLLTSFFVTDFMDTRTILARNGGVLNGIYRTSYFAMDSVSNNNNSDYYRFVDAIGGKAVMWMELNFIGDSLYFNSYTSHLGLNQPPSRHMTFAGRRDHIELSLTSAEALNYPQNIQAWDFSNGFVQEYLYVNEGFSEPYSASFLSYSETQDVFELAYWSGDPFIITDHPYLAYLNVNIVRNPDIEGKPLFINLSIDPLTDNEGYLSSDYGVYDTILLFPEIAGTVNEFLITYLHPGDYYVTIIADVNEDGYVSSGDYSHISQFITISPEGQHEIIIENIIFENSWY